MSKLGWRWGWGWVNEGEGESEGVNQSGQGDQIIKEYKILGSFHDQWSYLFRRFDHLLKYMDNFAQTSKIVSPGSSQLESKLKILKSGSLRDHILFPDSKVLDSMDYLWKYLQIIRIISESDIWKTKWLYPFSRFKVFNNLISVTICSLNDMYPNSYSKTLTLTLTRMNKTQFQGDGGV